MRMKRKGWLLVVLGLFFLVQAGGVAWSQVTERVSVDSAGLEGNSASTAPSISADGKFVAFESDATNLVGVGNDNNGAPDIFADHLQTGAGEGGGSGDGNSAGGCCIATAADGFGMAGEKCPARLA